MTEWSKLFSSDDGERKKTTSARAEHKIQKLFSIRSARTHGKSSPLVMASNNESFKRGTEKAAATPFDDLEIMPVISVHPESLGRVHTMLEIRNGETLLTVPSLVEYTTFSDINIYAECELKITKDKEIACSVKISFNKSSSFIYYGENKSEDVSSAIDQLLEQVGYCAQRVLMAMERVVELYEKEYPESL